MPDFSLKLYQLSIMALPFLLAVTMREALRGYVAHKLGDPTVKASGRLSANPLVHADPIWTGVIPIVAFVLLNLPILLGQGKPIAFNPQYFKDQRQGVILVTASGPASLLLLAIFWAILARLSFSFGFDMNDWLVQTAGQGIYLSCIFLVITLLPIPPLDGGKLLEFFLPEDAAQGLRSIEPFGFFIVIAIFIFAQAVIVVPAHFLFTVITTLVGV